MSRLRQISSGQYFNHKVNRKQRGHKSVKLCFKAFWCLVFLSIIFGLRVIFTSKWHIFIINLESRADRKLICEQNFRNYPHTFVLAISGKSLIGTAVVNNSQLLPGEIGCFFSHLKAVKALVKSNLKYAMVVEDDVVFTENFRLSDVHKVVKLAPQGWEAIALGNNLSPMRPYLGRINLNVMEGDLYGAYAVLYSIHGAKRLLQLQADSDVIEMPYDIWLGRSAKVYECNPSLAFVKDVRDSNTMITISDPPRASVTCNHFLASFVGDQNFKEFESDSHMKRSFNVYLRSARDFIMTELQYFENTMGSIKSIENTTIILDCFGEDKTVDWESTVRFGTVTAMKRRYSETHPLIFAGSSRNLGLYLAFYKA